MKLKIKLPLLFLLLFVAIIGVFTWYLSTILAAQHDWALRAVLGPLHLRMIIILLILMGLTFVILIMYLNYNVTQPLQLLNARLKRVNIRNTGSSLYSKRKDEIGELYHHVNEMEERLHQSHQEQLNMIAAIAHDLKTPLTSIQGFVELLALRKDLSEQEKQEYYELIIKKSSHIVELINVFSAFTKDEVELEAIEMKPVEAGKLFESIAAEYETELAGLAYELNWKHNFSPGQWLMINESMIRRVFGNLFSNAVRYGGRKDLKVYLSGNVQGEDVCFQVEDNGVGVPEEDLGALFQKFFTVEKSRQSKNGGNGLGLASCKSIVEHHGGEIEAFHSKYGGLGIRVRIPLAP